MVRIACIVEGDAEVVSLPILLRRIATEHLSPPVFDLDVPKPVFVHKSQWFSKREIEWRKNIEKAVARAKERLQGDGAILVLLDSDKDCPKEQVERLRPILRAVAGRSATSLVFAHREYESWFLHSITSLLPPGEDVSRCGPLPPAALDHHDAKSWVAQALGLRKYEPMMHQPSFTSRFSLQTALACPSFRKLVRDFERLIIEARALEAHP